MKPHVLAFPLLMLVAACTRTSSTRPNTYVQSGCVTIPYVRQLTALYPSAVHFVSHSTGQFGPPEWISKAPVAGRYILEIRMPVTVDQRAQRILSYNSPTFALYELTRVQLLPSGQLELSHGQTTRFGLSEWERFRASGGALSELGVPPTTTAPVDGFDLYWNELSRCESCPQPTAAAGQGRGAQP